MLKHILRLSGAILIVAIPVWLFAIMPQLVKLSNDFPFSAEVFSVDNFYDEQTGDYLGEQISVTQFTYDVVDEQDGVLIIKNLFDVRTPGGDKIFAVERLYGIDDRTGGHVAGYGDRDREGYLFAPIGLKQGATFTYWHINYDGPADMQFVGEEEILGLRVYRYESRYEGVEIDQTAQLGHLPGVPEERGVRLDPHLELWIEPHSGRLIKYEDQTVAYYYDRASGERLHPWNKFNNRYSRSSIAEQVRRAQMHNVQMIYYNYIIPAGLIVGAGILFLTAWLFRRKNLSDTQKIENMVQ